MRCHSRDGLTAIARVNGMSTNAPVQVGELEDLARPFQRYLLPLQTFRQALWLVGGLSFVMLAVYLFDVRYEGGHTTLRGWMFIGFAALAGGIPAWLPLLPARFLLTADGPARAVSTFLFIKGKAVKFGYREITMLAEGTMLSTRRFQWLNGRENRVLIADSGNVVSVTGPNFAIRHLYRICEKEYGSPQKS